MILKWRKVVIEDRQMKDYLIGYTTNSRGENEIQERLEKELNKGNVKRIIIEDARLEKWYTTYMQYKTH